MIWHPFSWAFWAVAATGALLYLVGAVRAIAVVIGWDPSALDAAQLRRERHAQTASLLGRWAFGCLAIAAIVALVGITRIWHRIIPGAMCGTGVLQATGVHGGRAIFFWGAALVLLYGWRVLDDLDRHHPQGRLASVNARFLLLAAPFLLPALLFTWQAWMNVAAVPTVSCCAAVYDRVADGMSASARWREPAAIFIQLAGTAVLLFLAASAIRSPDRHSGFLWPAVAILWGVGSMFSVKRVWSAYYYQVLSHPCPWCLFLPQYRGAGFLIFGCLAVVLVESIDTGLAGTMGTRHPTLAHPVRIRSRRSAVRVTTALIGFTLLTVGPALLWRLRNGVWLTGFP